MKLHVDNRTRSAPVQNLQFGAIEIGEVFSGELHMGCAESNKPDEYTFNGQMMKIHHSMVLVIDGCWSHLISKPKNLATAAFSVSNAAIVHNYRDTVATIILSKKESK